jgi:hypothetical protein
MQFEATRRVSSPAKETPAEGVNEDEGSACNMTLIELMRIFSPVRKMIMLYLDGSALEALSTVSKELREITLEEFRAKPPKWWRQEDEVPSVPKHSFFEMWKREEDVAVTAAVDALHVAVGCNHSVRLVCRQTLK